MCVKLKWLTVRPSMVCLSWRTRSRMEGSEKTTKAKPRGRPEGFSRMITACETSPYWPKYSLKVSSLVSHAIPPMNTFPSSESISLSHCPFETESNTTTPQQTLLFCNVRKSRLEEGKETGLGFCFETKPSWTRESVVY
jgi:hypothetical protein